jgi:hypothetical protein
MTENSDDNAFSPEYLSSLEENVLSELSSREKNYAFRFNGLRRILRDVHQQKLTRALERLQEDNLIERQPNGGYQLEDNSYDRIREYYSKQDRYFGYGKSNLDNEKIFTSISRDTKFPVKHIINRLSGKYFGDYRFIGHYYSEGRGQLEWIHAEDHSRILISTITPSKITMITYNVSKIAINKFLRILQQTLLEYQMVVPLTEETASQAN